MHTFEIGIALYERAEELDFAGPYEVLTAWARASERDIRVRTIADRDLITCSHGLKVVADVTWDDAGKLDLLVVPGGSIGDVQDDAAFIERLRDFAGAGTLMTSVCNGAILYATAGLLAGKRAATHWSAVERLRGFGIDVDESVRFVDEGMVVTSAGVSAGIDMALHLVARLESVEMSKEIRRYIQYEPAPDANHDA
ncbi:MAG TPA: DJ-1/PfpI family protein [Gaiellaceae bacterium]|nr:DJ-1/PfpI family protein [Gaiellaceae bacterium]